MALAVLESGVYWIQNEHTGTVLDLAGGSSQDGTKVQGFQKRALTDVWVPAQLWVVAKVEGNQVYTLQNAASRTYADLSNGGFSDGTPIVGFEGTSKSQQRWNIVLANDQNNYVIKNQASNTYIDLRDGNGADGAVIQIHSGEGASTRNQNQIWKFVHA